MKKFLSLIMAIAMVAMMSVASFAATVTDIQGLTDAVAAGGDVVLGADIEISTSLRVENNVNLDLNGWTLTGPHNYVGGQNLYAFIVDVGGTLTLDDNSDAQTGEIDCQYSGIETKGGTFIMNGGKITAGDMLYAAAIVNYGGSVVINDGEVKAYDTAISTQAYFTDTASTQINGGEVSLVEGNAEPYVLIQVGGEYNNGSTSLEVTGGELSGQYNIYVDTQSNAGGSMDVEVSGGSFTEDVTEYLAEDATMEDDGNGNFVVVGPEEEEREDREPSEPTPAELERDRVVAAIESAEDGATVVLNVKDTSVVSRLVADALSGKNVNLEYALGEETVTVNGKSVPKSPAYRVWYSLELFAQFA